MQSANQVNIQIREQGIVIQAGVIKITRGKVAINATAQRMEQYLEYLAILGVIFSLITIRGNYILAPPYAVSAYLIVFQKGTKYASRTSLLATYSLVIASSDLLHFMLGASLSGIIVNVIIVSAFITFTDLSHPPAIALTIFSYIAGDPLDFTISSVLSLSALLVASILLQKYDNFREHSRGDAID